MTKRQIYIAVAALAAAAVVLLGAPSWLALAAGMAIAIGSGERPSPVMKRVTTYALQLGVVLLGAGANLVVVWRVGSSGAAITALGLVFALGLALLLGRGLGVAGRTPLLIGVGTAICGGSAIAAVASVLEPDEHELSVSLAVVFLLNAVGLVLFPVLGHALGLDEPTFGRWAALAIHDTSSVVGAGMAYGATALQIATTTKLARALWIVPVTLGVAVAQARHEPGSTGRKLARVKWPYFIAGFVANAALFTWVPALAPAAHAVVLAGQRCLLLALFAIGLSLSREALAKVGTRPLVLGIVLWIAVAAAALGLARAA